MTPGAGNYRRPRGAIVFFGASAVTLSDIVATPLSPQMPASKPMRGSPSKMLSGVTLRRPGFGTERRVDGDGLALRGAGGDDLGFGPAIRGAAYSPPRSARSARSAGLHFRAAGFSSIRPIPAFSAALVYFTGVSTLYAVKRRREREKKIAPTFGRFVSPAVVARLAEMPEALELGGLRRAADPAVLRHPIVHHDLGGVQRLWETHFLNEYLTPIIRTISMRRAR